MFQEFDITIGKESVGKAVVERLGLYYKIRCRCVFPDRGIYRVQANGSAGTTDLGICVPMDTDFGILTKIPVKTLGEQIVGFRIISPKNNQSIKVVTITDTEPFRYIGQLKNACLVHEKRSSQVRIKLEINHPD